MIPSLFPPTVQIELLSRLLHRDLSNPQHQTNLHLHWDVTYPEGAKDLDCGNSFFVDDPTRLLYPKDPHTHIPLSIQSALEKKLRWIKLGSQDNTTAQLDAPDSVSFPRDIAKILGAVFPETEAQVATLNITPAGDTLTAHRDASDESDAGLLTVSFGCDSLFLASNGDEKDCEVIRLRSGDAVYMSGSARTAWHAVPKIVPSTCPQWLTDWPLSGEDSGPLFSPYQLWRGWISEKQIALNVRQITRSHA